MSGHSHFATIKRKKGVEDKKRGQIFSKMAKLISVAAKQGGGNPETNSKLRLAIETAKNVNLPKENIDRAIKKGTGEIASEKLEEILFEAYGPAGAAIIIECITDNKNRALSEIKQILSSYGVKLVGEGGAKWMFERKINQETGSPEWLAKQEIEITEKEKIVYEKLFEALDENDSVQEIYSNIKT